MIYFVIATAANLVPTITMFVGLNGTLVGKSSGAILFTSVTSSHGIHVHWTVASRQVSDGFFIVSMRPLSDTVFLSAIVATRSVRRLAGTTRSIIGTSGTLGIGETQECVMV